MSDTNHTDRDEMQSWSDCVDFWFDGPGDHTIRPIPPERLAQAKAVRNQILEVQAGVNRTAQDARLKSE